MVLVCGVEEAGRGPVIGPLVMAGCMLEEKDIDTLDSIGVKDSKLLTPIQREALFDKIKKICKYKILIIEPKEIDDILNSDDLNLNWLEAIKSAQIINELNPDKAILDCPSNNISSYSDYVKKHLEKEVEIIAEHKADLNYTIVGAASILAKVTRDREIEKLKKKLNINFGSGYPSDPRTKKFVEEFHNKYSGIFRETWSTFQKAKLMKKQKKLGEF